MFFMLFFTFLCAESYFSPTLYKYLQFFKSPSTYKESYQSSKSSGGEPATSQATSNTIPHNSASNPTLQTISFPTQSVDFFHHSDWSSSSQHLSTIENHTRDQSRSVDIPERDSEPILNQVPSASFSSGAPTSSSCASLSPLYPTNPVGSFSSASSSVERESLAKERRTSNFSSSDLSGCPVSSVSSSASSGSRIHSSPSSFSNSNH